MPTCRLETLRREGAGTLDDRQVHPRSAHRPLVLSDLRSLWRYVRSSITPRSQVLVRGTSTTSDSTLLVRVRQIAEHNWFLFPGMLRSIET
jgi:hypothetical protein